MSITKVINNLSVDNLNLMEMYSGFLFLVRKKSIRW